MECDNREKFFDTKNITNNILSKLKSMLNRRDFQNNEITDIVNLMKELYERNRNLTVPTFNKLIINEYIERNYRDSATLIKNGERRHSDSGQNNDAPPQSSDSLLANIFRAMQLNNELASHQLDAITKLQLSNITTQNKLEHNQYIIHFNSLSRDYNTYSNPANYRMNFQQTQVNQTRGYIKNLPTITNIVTIELISCTVPNFYKNNSINSYNSPFLYLRIDEVEGDVYSSTYDYRVFAQLQFSAAEMESTADFINVDTENYKYVKVFSVTSAFSSLSVMTFRFIDHLGNFINFGTDNLSISSVSAANPTVITTTAAHGLQKGDLIYIIGHVSTGGTSDQQQTADSFLNSSSGVRVNSVPSSTTFTVDFNNQAGGGATGNILIGRLQNNMSIRITTLT